MALQVLEHPSDTLLRIYLWCVEQGRPVGPREIMRVFGMSSPSTAYYYLNRLVQLGLMERRAGEYVVVKKINIEGYFWLGNKLVPRLLIYSSFFTGITVVYVIAIVGNILNGVVDPHQIPPTMVSALASLLMLIEGMQALKRLRVRR